MSFGLFNDFFLLKSFLSLFSLLGFHTQDDVTDLGMLLSIIVVLTHAERLESLKGTLILRSDLSQSNTGGSLLANKLS